MKEYRNKQAILSGYTVKNNQQIYDSVYATYDLYWKLC